jgi:hypothetical protein
MDENRALREIIGAALGALLPNLTHRTTDDELNAVLQNRNIVDERLIRVSNASTVGQLAIRVEIASPLFRRAGFPAEFSQGENFSQRLLTLLP